MMNPGRRITTALLSVCLGLCLVGCRQNNRIVRMEAPAFNMQTNPKSMAVRLMAPRRRPPNQTQTMQTRQVVQASIPSGQAVSLSAPVTRVSHKTYPPAHASNPSRWRYLGGARYSSPQPTVVQTAMSMSPRPKKPSRPILHWLQKRRPIIAMGSKASTQQPTELPMPTNDGQSKKKAPVVQTPIHVAHGPVGHHAGRPYFGGPEEVAPREGTKVALPPYVVEPPDILLVEVSRKIPDTEQPIGGQHLVRPDGTISLGVYGSVYVAGMTLDQARRSIYQTLLRTIKGSEDDPFEESEIYVDVLAYNSKVYYVITDGGGYGEQVYRIPATGNETVLDALAQINGLPAVASKKKIWLARSNAGKPTHPQIFPIDWKSITQSAYPRTNYQVYPGDRIYVASDPKISVDSFLAKLFSPIERVLGVTLLGSSVVNSIAGRGNFGGGGNR